MDVHLGPMSPPKSKQSHHHGNLRSALIEAGVELLAEGGPEALTLRGCAARAGVSHAAPAHHFNGLGGLKAAIAGEGFRRFRECMEQAARDSDQTPRGRLKGICRGYLEFARSHPALFELIFGFDAGPGPRRPPLEQGLAAYAVLRETCAPFVPPGEDPAVVEAQVWSLVHGYVTLQLSRRLWPDRLGGTGAGVPDRFDEVMVLLDRIGELQG
jgi:AcrR family transcriptional regulator